MFKSVSVLCSQYKRACKGPLFCCETWKELKMNECVSKALIVTQTWKEAVKKNNKKNVTSEVTLININLM